MWSTLPPPFTTTPGGFVRECRNLEVTPHLSQKQRSAIDQRMPQRSHQARKQGHCLSTNAFQHPVRELPGYMPRQKIVVSGQGGVTAASSRPLCTAQTTSSCLLANPSFR